MTMPEPPPGFEHEALTVDTYVAYEHGQWVVVYMDVIFWDETVHHRIQAYPRQRLAKSPPIG